MKRLTSDWQKRAALEAQKKQEAFDRIRRLTIMRGFYEIKSEVSDWILATGFWQDINFWRDDQNWID